ncbi:MAG: N-acetylmuramoyl-L-alanine amidase [Bacilli bacterium]|nr:N-acetylmuramoyl-L-alanine amidase [Bacilli bacterium]MDD3120937.1 N-acetylmuramoyl-L-alanine amidase [Bacilli bacterium]MDD4481751.1 N-acetylmuramoyl-L-alanine amidase [Bacilli bacterium]
MKRVVSILFILILSLILIGCKEELNKEVNQINDFVSNLPEEVTIDLESDIDSMITLYNNLSAEEKEEVTNYNKLLEAKEVIIDLHNEEAALIIVNLINDLDEEVTLSDEDKYLNIKEKLDEATAEVLAKITNKTSFDNKYTQYLELKSGPSDEDKNKALAVDTLILNLPEETTLEDKEAIEAARSEYTALTNDQKELVTKLSILEEKEAELVVLENEQADKDKAFEIDTLIANLPEQITLEDKEAIEAARSAYTALTNDQKAFVEELETLEAKELAYDNLLAEANTNANQVVNLINEIPSPVKASDKENIEFARNAYDNLSEFEKSLVTNYNVLEEKELELANLPPEELTFEERVQKSIEKITTSLSNNLTVSGDLDFYSKDTEFGPSILWQTSNLDIINSSGLYTAPLYDTDIIITYTASLRGITSSGSIAVRASSVSTEEKWDMIDTFLNYINKKRIENSKYTMFGYEAGYEQNPGEDLGFLMFYTGENPEIIEDIVTNNPYVRTNIIKKSTEWIVIHDTGSGSPSADAYMHNNYIKSISGSSKSWHYTVGDDRIYHHLPNDEVSWNAGDGSTEYELIPTGVKVETPVKPKVTIDPVDGYFYLDNKKTDIVAPTGNIGQILTNDDINSTGLHVEEGEDGYYYMAKTHFGSYGKICNTGGNRNSVSMETCVNAGSNYMMTMRKAAALTAMLLVDFDLTPDRVRQHQTFSGKNCPQTIRTAGKWDEFMYMVKVEYYGRKYLNDVTFEYLPKANYFDKLGMVVNHPGNQTTVTYDVKVTFGGETKLFTYSSVIAGKIA